MFQLFHLFTYYFARFGRFGGFVSVFSLVSFLRSFGFVVSGFSTCQTERIVINTKFCSPVNTTDE